MKRALLVAGTAALLVAAPIAGASGAGVARAIERGPHAASSSRFVPGEVIVGLRPQASRAALARVHARVPARVAKRFPAFHMELVKLSRGISVRDAIRAYRADPAVAFAEPNYLRYPDVIPGDALFDDLWGLNNTGQSHPVADADGDDTANPHSGSSDADIDAPEAWDVEQGNGTVIAVLDTGVDVTHPDLDGQLWVNPGEDCPGCQTDGVDNDGNLKVDDVNGWDFANNDNTLLDTPPHFEGFEHGTHVAGTIAAELNDSGTGDGVVGVCPACKIMVLKVAADSDGSISIASEVAALAYAKAKGARIANMSLGGPDWSNAEREAIRTSGLLVAVSAGNESLDSDMALASDLDTDGTFDIFSPSYPAAYTLPNILSVAASNDEDRYAYSSECFELLASRPLCAFTNWGHDSVDVAAPGADITSTFPGSNWHTWDGTSMAAPHVAGVAGLVLAHNPTYSVAQVKNAVMNSVDKPTSLGTMYMAPAPGLTGSNGTTRLGIFTRTSGRINAAAALTASTASAAPLTDGNINGAKAMTLAKVGGSISWPADINDVKKRKLYKGHTYRITLVVPAGKDYDLLVWKPGTKEIWQSIWQSLARLRAYSAHGGSVDEVVRFKALSTGTYYIHVSAWLFKSGKYTLSIKRLS
ncbi:MAG TPA: S8 family peptidase [Gaiellaceae bacterium]